MLYIAKNISDLCILRELFKFFNYYQNFHFAVQNNANVSFFEYNILKLSHANF